MIQHILLAAGQSDDRKTRVIRRSPLAPAYFIGRPAELWIYALSERRRSTSSALTKR
jgi:hypothetical protein